MEQNPQFYSQVNPGYPVIIQPNTYSFTPQQVEWLNFIFLYLMH